MADLMTEGARTLTFVRSRRGAELTALGTRARLEDTAPELADLVASYRAGYLAEDRRELGHTHWPTDDCAVWPPPTRWSSASTSPGWMRWYWPGFPVPSPRSGSRPAGPADVGRAR